MIIHGLRPGPMLMKDQPQFFWVILGCLVISNLFLIIFGMTGIKLFTKIVEIPKAIVIPIIIVLSIVGSYSINNSVVDIYWMIAFGILGYFFKIYNYPTAPMVLGMILSPIIDINYRRAMALNHNNFYELINSLLGSPISFTLIFLIMLMPLSKLKFWKRIKMF